MLSQLAGECQRVPKVLRSWGVRGGIINMITKVTMAVVTMNGIVWYRPPKCVPNIDMVMTKTMTPITKIMMTMMTMMVIHHGGVHWCKATQGCAGRRQRLRCETDGKINHLGERAVHHHHHQHNLHPT